jgi:hypothetical protein
VEISQLQTDMTDVVDFAFRATPSKVLELTWEVFNQLQSRPMLKLPAGSDTE